MLDLLALVPFFPFVAFATLVLAGDGLSRRAVALIGITSIALTTFVSCIISIAFIASPPAGLAYTKVLWQWLDVGNLGVTIAFRLDALSLVMLLVVSFVALLIHLYSAEFMVKDDGYRRFFAYMNLFVAAMLTLVLADNLVLLLMGWEGVGLCSYLLIGFWYRDPANGRAARKAFLVTRIGDTALLIGIFVIFANLGTLDIQELMKRAALGWPVGSSLAVAAAALLLGGALGKSAQLPLQVWLPDAMAGPTPVSALIHAATMVTAGVYLIARTHALFSLAPAVLFIVALLGAATLIYAALSALVQSDLKRALAYSTMSQIGYMFLALGAGAWSAAIFHFVTHAFFKALLFLSAGVVIVAVRHEQNMFRMGGLRRYQPMAFWTFLIGAASLSAIPLVTAGFYSKDSILLDVWSSAIAGPGFWVVGAIGAFLTAVYSFRMVFLVFYGNSHEEAPYRPGIAIRLPLAMLAVFAVFVGFLQLPRTLGNLPLLSHFLSSVLPNPPMGEQSIATEGLLQIVTTVSSLLGVYIAYVVFLRRRASISVSPARSSLAHFLKNGWGFDWFYERLFVRPYVFLATAGRQDFMDGAYQGLATFAVLTNRALVRTESGRVRWYAFGIAVGAIVAVGIGLNQ